jgi:hypothetical protein
MVQLTLIMVFHVRLSRFSTRGFGELNRHCIVQVKSVPLGGVKALMSRFCRRQKIGIVLPDHSEFQELRTSLRTSMLLLPTTADGCYLSYLHLSHQPSSLELSAAGSVFATVKLREKRKISVQVGHNMQMILDNPPIFSPNSGRTRNGRTSAACIDHTASTVNGLFVPTAAVFIPPSTSGNRDIISQVESLLV